MTQFVECFSETKKQRILEIMKSKVKEAKKEGMNFLVYVSNPVKVCRILSQFLTLLSDDDYLKHPVRNLKAELL